MKWMGIVLLILIVSFSSCQTGNSEKEVVAEKKESVKDTVSTDNWKTKFDFDGDRINDSIAYSFSGGAHCCYQLTAYLSSGKNVELPFFIEGGYVQFDLSDPDNFDIQDKDADKVFGIVINLNHYAENRSLEELNVLKKKFGFTSNKITVQLVDGILKVENAE